MNPIEAAKAARLRYVSDEMPGIRRERRGGSFTYIAPDGSVIKDEEELARIKSLAVPPAYEDVWICPIPNGHMQATARDARGRKQYRYHKRWREVRDETKFERTIAFAHALPKIRKRLEADLSLPDLPREKVLATIVQLLETTAIRIGNDEYAKENNSYGLTTLRNTHAKVEGSKVRFSFRGKSGVRQAVDLRDRRLARIIRRCQDLPGQQLFEYVDDDGAVHSVDSSDVNEYIRAISGDEFSAKDFRTWVATVTCAVLLASDTVEELAGARKQRTVDVIKEVAKRLGNTPAVCRKCYVHPKILESYLESGQLAFEKTPALREGLSGEERFTLALLERQQNARQRKKKAA